MDDAQFPATAGSERADAASAARDPEVSSSWDGHGIAFNNHLPVTVAPLTVAPVLLSRR